MKTLGPYALNSIITGDARELAQAIPDNSVDLIFTDPVYQNIEDYAWLAETAARVLKPDRACLVWCGIGFLDLTIEALKTRLAYRWQGIWYISNGMKRADMGFCNYSPFLWMEKGRSKPFKPVADIAMVAIPDPGNARNHQNHKWEKQIGVIKRYLEAFACSGSTVVDFFTGSATIPVVCKMLGLDYWACEIDPPTADRARQRVEMTQPPLFVMQPEQAVMSL
jgi:DNA modification methylase